jgi:hypothetical protein
MKKIFYSAALVLALAACSDEDYNSAFREYAGIKTTGIPTAPVAEGTKVVVTVGYGGQVTNATSRTISYKITGGEYGTDYTVVGGTGATGTVTIPEGPTKDAKVTFEVQSLHDFIEEDDITLTIEITDAAGLQIGYPYQPKVKVTFLDDDCTFDEETWKGTFSALEDYATGSDYGPYDVTFEQDAVDPNKYIFHKFWDSGITAYIIFDPNSNVVTFPAQDDGDGTAITGSGTYNQCSKTMVISTQYAGYSWQYRFTKK